MLPPATKKKEKSKLRVEDPFEFCEVCKLNHDQGRRHKYFPSHVRSLSSLLSRFQKKIAGLLSFLKNPSIIGSHHSNLDRLWCVFCGLDVLELDSAFACSSAIYHLASSEHLRNLKDFLRKHGGGMDLVDSFRVSDADLIKWEKGCKSLKSAASTSSEGAIGQLPVLSKAMRIIECVLKSLMQPQELFRFPMLQVLFQGVFWEMWVFRICVQSRASPFYQVHSLFGLETMTKC